MDVLERGRRFIETQARLLERRIFETVFDHGDPAAVVAALRAYKNPDGGFGHALEPDLRASASQPLFAEVALTSLREANAEPGDLLDGLPEFLESVSTPDGAVSPALAGDYPCADHFKLEWATTPQLNPTAGIAGRLHACGVRRTEVITSAHTMNSAFALLEAMPDAALFDRLANQLPDCEWYQPEVPVEGYGVTPLKIAPTPEHPTRALIADEVIEAHLDDLLGRQQPDGGWPIHWKAPGPAAVAEWRGRWTLEALLTLRAYGRL
jgi:hypothetical protein